MKFVLPGVVLMSLALPLQSDAQVLGRIPFQTHPYKVYDANGSERQTLGIDTDVYGPKGPGHLWSYEHRTDGTGWNGRNFVRMFWWDYASSGVQEQEIGFTFTGSSLTPPSGGWRDGVEYFIRFRIRLNSTPSPISGGGATVNNKFLITNWGGTRMMIHMRTSNGSACGAYSTTTYPPDRWASMRISRNIDGPTDGYCANIPVQAGQWNHLQYSVRFGGSGTAFVKAWVNNNDYARPSGTDTTGSAWPQVGMADLWQLGGYVSDPSARDVVWDLMDFEVATTFASDWASGTSGGTVDAPAAPTNVRIIREAALWCLPLPVAIHLLRKRRPE